MDPKKRHTCTYCDKAFTTTSNRNKHVRRVHLHTLDDIVLDKDEVKRAKPKKRKTPVKIYADPQVLRCNYCGKTFSTPQHRRTHEETIHDAPSHANPNTSLTCNKCSSTFASLNIYREHLHQAHQILTNRVEQEFTSEKEFKDWKTRLEMDVGVNYTLHSGPKKGRYGSKQTYFCRRSGVKRLSTQESKRAGKRQGSCKIGQFCTSSIDVVRSGGRLKVTYFVDHHDHDIDGQTLVHMKLPKCDKSKVAAMITLGLSYDKILDQVREMTGMHRASLLEKKDIENIASEFGLKQDTRRHPVEYTSIQLAVEELQEAGELLYFKEQGVTDQDYPNINEKDFVLGFMTKGQEVSFSNHLKNTENIQVCMDSTHSLSLYAGYQLTTLMMVTDLNEGFPVAFLISSSVNTTVVKAFLDKVKQRMGTIRAHIFMSADDPLYRKAWEESMSGETVPFYLNCFWHTDRTFRKSIASKIQAPTTEKAVIYQMLRALMDEPEEDVFREECKGFLRYLLEAGFNDFHDYFTQNYLDEKRIKLWPKCFHNNVTHHTNNHLENMHRVLKYVYVRGKKAKRLDCTIITIQKVVNNKLYERMIELMQNRTIGRNRYRFSERHSQRKGVKLGQKEQDIYRVYSAFSEDQQQYEVRLSDQNCKACKEKCPYCHVCHCMYVCSCQGGEGRKRICEHIQAVVDFRKGSCTHAKSNEPPSETTVHKDPSSETNIPKDPTSETTIAKDPTSKTTMPKDPTSEIAMIQEEVCIETSPSESVVKELQEKILGKISLNFLPKCRDLKDLHILKAVDTLITEAIAMLDDATKSRTSTSQSPRNKGFVKQDRPRSTKRKREEADEGAGLGKSSSRAGHVTDDSVVKEGDVGVPDVSKGDVQHEHCYC